MRKNEVGKALKIIGVLSIILGAIGSIIMGFTTVEAPLDSLYSYAVPTTVTFSFSQAISGIFATAIAGVLLIGLSEVIYILDEHRENSRRLCRRFGIKPVEYDDYAQARAAINNRRGIAPQQGVAPQQMNQQGMPQNQQAPLQQDQKIQHSQETQQVKEPQLQENAVQNENK